MNFLDLEINQKNYIKILTLCICIVILILIWNFALLLIPKQFNLEESTKVVAFEEEKDLIVHIDILAPQGKKVEIVGYAYREDESVRTVNCSYVLRNASSGKMYLLKTRHEKNINVPEVYPYAGMHTRFMTLGIENGNYEICVLYRNDHNDFLKDTGIRVDI